MPLLGAGAVVSERWLHGRRRLTRTRILAALAVGGLVVLPISLPVLPAATLARTSLNEINPELGEAHAWASFVEQVGAAYASVPIDQRAGAAVFTLSYGRRPPSTCWGPTSSSRPRARGTTATGCGGRPMGSPS